MHQFEDHHFASRFASCWWGKDSGFMLEKIAGIPPPPKQEVSGTGNGAFPFGKRGAKATQNGNHNLVHVKRCFRGPGSLHEGASFKVEKAHFAA